MRGACALLGGVLFAAAVTGCYREEPPYRPDLTSFKVTVEGVYNPRPEPMDGKVEFGDPGTPLPVVSRCQKAHGGEANVPRAERGTVGCPYAIPQGEVELDVKVVALNKQGDPLKSFSGNVSFRVIPGDLTGGYAYRFLQVKNGVGTGVLKSAHLFSDVRVWVEDGPPLPIYVDGERVEEGLPDEPEERTYASAASEPVWFEDPTVARVQTPDGFDDNRSSPFVGSFITIGRAKTENTSQVTQSCENDPDHDGKPALLVVTGTDPTGFFVTDLNACRLVEQVPNSFTVPEPDGYFPGTFGSLFIYNYSFPEGLNTGDTLWSVAGAVQEFTSTTQLTFPSWVIAEEVRLLPESQWDKYLSQVPIPEISLRTCGLGEGPFITDQLCGQGTDNMKLESLESALVRVRNVKFSDVFAPCDLNGDGEVPFFCNRRSDGNSPWYWGDCDFDDSGTITEEEKAEVACNVECVTSQGDYTQKVCSERATFVGFGQFQAQMAGPGPREAGLDDSIPARIETVPVTAGSTLTQGTWGPDTLLHLWCNTPVRVAFGNADVEATAQSEALPANTRLDRFLGPNQDRLAVIADGPLAPDPKCYVGANPRTRINIVTRDAVPELEPDCNPNDEDAAKAAQCQAFRAATWDVVGHLRHLQPGRPRWVILPRDKDDLCCHPAEGLGCPAPIKPCE